MSRKHIALFFFGFFFARVLFAQSIVSVNPSTGTGSIQIPVYTLNSGEVSVPISISYAATGVKTRDAENTAGMGFQLNAGGQISRQVRGLPDDVTKDNSGVSETGWMIAVNPGAGYAMGFVPQNDDNFSTCTDETSDIDNINTYMPYTYDTEPDIFSISAPGLSCQFVWDRVSGAFHPLIYHDLVFQYTLVGGTGGNASQIASFTITTDRGIKYVFAAPETVTQLTTLGNVGTPSYFKTKYSQYQNGITYYDAWNLTSITDPYGNGVTFTYTTAPARGGADPVVLFIGGVSSTSVEYNVLQSVIPQTLSAMGTTNVNFSNPSLLSFSWNGLSSTGETYVTNISGMGHLFVFNYTLMVYTPTGYSRSFLTNFTDAAGCSSPTNYTFSYIGESSGGSGYTTTLPDSTSNEVDYWGYYSSSASGSTLIPSVYVLNPVISYYPRYVVDASGSPGSDYEYGLLASNNRAVTTSTVYAGTLNEITYINGGATRLVYESNSYVDAPSGNIMLGGGIRVKQVIDSAGNGSPNIVRNYSYNNPSTGLSSGTPLTLPQFAFTIPYSGSATGLTLWQDATALSAYDLSTDDHTIMYAYSTVSQTGAGSTTYQYNVTPTYWTSNASTVNDVARYTCSSTYGPIQNYSYSYPFIPNPNWDYERSMLLKVTNFMDAGTEVSEKNYTYTPSFSPTSIQAFQGDDYGPSLLVAKGYNVYTIYFGASELTASVNTKVFDSNTLSQSQSSTVNYTYASSYHKLVTKQQTNNSDGSSETVNYQYAKDFTATATGGTSNPNVTAIYNLIQQNINLPIESYRQTTPVGGSLTTTSASITLYRDTTIGSATEVIPASEQKWFSAGGGSFSQMTISGATLTKSGNYLPVENFDIYDNTGFPRTVDDNYKHVQTTLMDHYSSQPTAVFSNAAYNQVAFSDFDTDPAAPPSCSFTFSGTEGFTPTGGHAGNAYGLGTSQIATSPTISKSSLAQNYIFSIWTNTTTAGTLTVTINSTTYPMTYTNSGTWIYHEISIPASTLPSSFTFTFAANSAVAIDDILFYPDNAEATTATYDALQHFKVAATNTNGVSAYYTNDLWGRMLFAYDQNHYITQKNMYMTPADIGSMNSPVIAASNPTNGVSTSFSVTGPDNCAAAGVTITWNFGDGTTTTSAGLISPSHTYTGLTTDTVRATINSPLFGTIVVPYQVITVQGANVPLSYSSLTTSYGTISQLTFTPVGSGTSYTFTTPAQINSGHVIQGNYTVKVYMVGDEQYNSGTGAGYDSVQLSSNCFNSCQNYTKTQLYTFNANLSTCTSLAVYIYQTACP